MCLLASFPKTKTGIFLTAGGRPNLGKTVWADREDFTNSSIFHYLIRSGERGRIELLRQKKTGKTS